MARHGRAHQDPIHQIALLDRSAYCHLTDATMRRTTMSARSTAAATPKIQCTYCANSCSLPRSVPALPKPRSASTSRSTSIHKINTTMRSIRYLMFYRLPPHARTARLRTSALQARERPICRLTLFVARWTIPRGPATVLSTLNRPPARHACPQRCRTRQNGLPSPLRAYPPACLIH